MSNLFITLVYPGYYKSWEEGDVASRAQSFLQNFLQKFCLPFPPLCSFLILIFIIFLVIFPTSVASFKQYLLVAAKIASEVIFSELFAGHFTEYLWN